MGQPCQQNQCQQNQANQPNQLNQMDCSPISASLESCQLLLCSFPTGFTDRAGPSRNSKYLSQGTHLRPVIKMPNDSRCFLMKIPTTERTHPTITSALTRTTLKSNEIQRHALIMMHFNLKLFLFSCSLCTQHGLLNLPRSFVYLL